MNWITGRIALLRGRRPPAAEEAHVAIMAIEDGWVLGEHPKRCRTADGTLHGDAVLATYNAVRPEHCRPILTTGRASRQDAWAVSTQAVRNRAGSTGWVTGRPIRG